MLEFLEGHVGLVGHLIFGWSPSDCVVDYNIILSFKYLIQNVVTHVTHVTHTRFTV